MEREELSNADMEIRKKIKIKKAAAKTVLLKQDTSFLSYYKIYQVVMKSKKSN